MLVLTRKKEDAIRIGKDIVIKIIATDKNSVRIGIEAPEDVVILREELVEAIREENRKAAEKIDERALRSLKTRLHYS